MCEVVALFVSETGQKIGDCKGKSKQDQQLEGSRILTIIARGKSGKRGHTGDFRRADRLIRPGKARFNTSQILHNHSQSTQVLSKRVN